jgi:hypothetical protein
MRYQPRFWRTCSRSSWPVLRIEEADEQLIPLHAHHAPDPAWRRTVRSIPALLGSHRLFVISKLEEDSYDLGGAK